MQVGLHPSIILNHIFKLIDFSHFMQKGKTTTTEQMLYFCGETNAVGRVDDGNTVMDFLPQERERGITISSAAISFKWKQHQINLIDTPGNICIHTYLGNSFCLYSIFINLLLNFIL